MPGVSRTLDLEFGKAGDDRDAQEAPGGGDDRRFDSYNRGLFVLAIDPARLRSGPDAAARHSEKLFEAIAGFGGRLPGDRRLRHRAGVDAGGLIEVASETLAAIAEYGE